MLYAQLIFYFVPFLMKGIQKSLQRLIQELGDDINNKMSFTKIMIQQYVNNNNFKGKHTTKVTWITSALTNLQEDPAASAS